MTWLIWRQHRQQALFGAATLALVTLLLLLTGLHMHSVFQGSGLGRCLGSRHPDCGNLQTAFESRFSTLRQLVVLHGPAGTPGSLLGRATHWPRDRAKQPSMSGSR
jgi:hypothetical protein